MASVNVVLLQDVPNLGKIGDVTRVAGGFARNYLLPQRLAVTATGTRLSDTQFKRELEGRREEAERVEADRLAALLQGQSIVITVTVGDQGRMHGQITNQDVARALDEQLGVEVDRHLIQIDSPIRSLGRYLLPIRLAAGLEPSVTLEVSEPSDEPEPEAPDAADAEVPEEPPEPAEALPAEDINPADFAAPPVPRAE